MSFGMCSVPRNHLVTSSFPKCLGKPPLPSSQPLRNLRPSFAHDALIPLKLTYSIGDELVVVVEGVLHLDEQERGLGGIGRDLINLPALHSGEIAREFHRVDLGVRHMPSKRYAHLILKGARERILVRPIFCRVTSLRDGIVIGGEVRTLNDQRRHECYSAWLDLNEELLAILRGVEGEQEITYDG